jgi:hypothetical protein
MASLHYKGLPQQGAGTDRGSAQTNLLSKFGKLSVATATLSTHPSATDKLPLPVSTRGDEAGMELA